MSPGAEFIAGLYWETHSGHDCVRVTCDPETGDLWAHRGYWLSAGRNSSSVPVHETRDAVALIDTEGESLISFAEYREFVDKVRAALEAQRTRFKRRGVILPAKKVNPKRTETN